MRKLRPIPRVGKKTFRSLLYGILFFCMQMSLQAQVVNSLADDNDI